MFNVLNRRSSLRNNINPLCHEPAAWSPCCFYIVDRYKARGDLMGALGYLILVNKLTSRRSVAYSCFRRICRDWSEWLCRLYQSRYTQFKSPFKWKNLEPRIDFSKFNISPPFPRNVNNFGHLVIWRVPPDFITRWPLARLLWEVIIIIIT